MEKHLIQPLFFQTGKKTEELYFRGKGVIQDGQLRISSGETARLDTYFNLFPLREWEEWTEIDRFFVEAELAGSGILRLYGLSEDGNESLIAESEFHTEDPGGEPGAKKMVTVAEELVMKECPPFCFLEIAARSEVTLRGGGLTTAREPQNPVRLACCFCTYKREKEIVRNVNGLIRELAEKEGSLLRGALDVLIADNGHTLKRENFVSSEHIRLYRNPNYGGSAGFTRCLMEGKLRVGKGDYTHFILMDDDAQILPCVVERTARLLSYVREEYREAAVGGAMLSLQEPWVQLENGAVWAVHKPEVRGYDADLRDRGVLLRNQEGRMDYNGWFFACFPAAFVTERNLPMPFFIHGDDIGYGLRNKAGWIHMNGICIWHPNPQIARRPYMLYYDSRNYKIVNNEHLPERKVFQVAMTDCRILLALACQYRYEDCWYQLQGTRDYLKGPDWFIRQDPEKLNRELMGKKKYEECRIGMDGVQLQEACFIPKRKQKTVLAWLFPADRKRVVYDRKTGWDKIRMFRVREYCLVDESTGAGIILKKSYRKWFRIMGQAAGMAVQTLLRYGKASVAWKKSIPEMSSEAFWESCLETRKE